MIIPIGSLINCGTIIVGGMTGLLLGNRLSEAMRTLVFQGLGLCTLVIGMQLALQTTNPLYMIFSILLGGIFGQIADLDGKLENFGDRLKKRLKSKTSTFTEGFITATMLFGVGSMAILGPIEEGLSGDMSILLTKSMLDGFAAIALTAALGAGVMFSVIPIFLYQGSITIFAVHLQDTLTGVAATELKAAGGVLILGIGLSLLNLLKIKLTNFLPALLVVVFMVYLAEKILHQLPETVTACITSGVLYL